MENEQIIKNYTNYRESNCKEEDEEDYLEVEELKRINKPVLKKFLEYLKQNKIIN